VPGPLATALLKKINQRELPEYSDLTPHCADACYNSDLTYVLSAACALPEMGFRFAAIERLVGVLRANPNYTADEYGNSPVDVLFLNEENRPVINWLLEQGATFVAVLDDPGENEFACEYAGAREASRAVSLGCHAGFYGTPEQCSGGDGARRRSPKKTEQADEGGACLKGGSSRRLVF
jgi:hypothetical protein